MAPHQETSSREGEPLTIRVPRRMLAELRRTARTQDRSVSSAVRIAINNWLRAHREPEKR